ncbi:MAG: hypothetical protein IPH30_14360 [Betaproteobacteria bacterium]|nr:hypothetical protein [Betaproteobacteria bacterium]
MRELIYEYRELAVLALAFIFFLGNYIEFRSNQRRDLAIAGNAFVTVALVVIVTWWDRAGAWRWLIAVALGLICTIATVALYGTSSRADRLRSERSSGSRPLEGE